jgi:hypothetical protein
MSLGRIAGIRLSADGVGWVCRSALQGRSMSDVTRDAARHKPVFASSVPSVPRLRLGRVLSRRTLLDGGWWPRSADPVAELPGLIGAIDDRCGRVTRLMLGPAGWDSQPLRLGIAGRVVHLGWFPGQPADLLTAFCGNDRVDLLVVPPGTAEADALAAVDLAAQTANRVHAPDILTAVAGRPAPSAEMERGLSVWESEGGRLAEAN